jgi:hypothetical protein
MFDFLLQIAISLFIGVAKTQKLVVVYEISLSHNRISKPSSNKI